MKKKRIKQILSVLLSAVLLCSAAVPVFALDQDNNSGSAEVSYTEEATWSASIPAYIYPAEPGQQDVNAYTVSATDVVIPDNTTLTATVEYSGVVRDKSGAEIPYTLYTADGAIQSGDTILQKAAGDSSDTAAVSFGASINEKARYAGVYTDTATFTFTVAEKVYTAEEIEADEHLFAIGKTKPEYVVAKFNDDFTEVTIFKNGEDSDGIIKRFVNGGSSVATHCDTLRHAQICNGVVNAAKFLFQDCAKLESVEIADTVKTIEASAFNRCSELTSVVIPNGVTSIESRAFGACGKLKAMEIPASVTSLAGDFVLGYSLEGIYVDENNPNYCDVNGVLFNKDKTKLIKLPSAHSTTYEIPSTVEVIGSYAITGNTISNIVIPNSVKVLEARAFVDADMLRSIVLPDSVIDVGEYAFENCWRLESVRLSNSMSEIKDSTFSGCACLEEIQIPASITRIENPCINPLGGIETVTIKGAADSYAETWASENGYTFVAQ